MAVVGFLIDEIPKFFHKTLKCDGCPYLNVIYEIPNLLGNTKNGCGHFYMLSYDNFWPKALPRACFCQEFKNQNGHKK